jgi:VanZ family protein
MSNLQNQPTAWPTRKLAAVIIAGMVVGGLQAAAQAFFPGYNATELLKHVDFIVQGLVMAAAGYWTKERV